jgi:methyl-accepting chemotaxis protein
MAQMQSGLREMVRTIRDTSRNLVTSAQGLSATSRDVVGSTDRQSDGANAMAAAVEQLAATISHMADNAGNVSRRVSDAGKSATRGSEVVHATSDEMRGIAGNVRETGDALQSLGAASQRITAIVDSIRGIAEQTNLLALNATIEAARAGEQGRGFAVVADEVRKLAERTTHSTQEIGGMVESIRGNAAEALRRMDQSLERVEAGVAKSEDAHAAMVQISDGTVQMVSDVQDITRALDEQRTASDLIARSIEDVVTLTQSNLRSVTDIAAHIDELERMAENLSETVGRFRV